MSLLRYYTDIKDDFYHINKDLSFINIKQPQITCEHIKHCFQLAAFVTKFWDVNFPTMSTRNVNDLCKQLTNISVINSMDESEFSDYYHTYINVRAHAHIIADNANAYLQIEKEKNKPIHWFEEC